MESKWKWFSFNMCENCVSMSGSFLSNILHHWSLLCYWHSLRHKSYVPNNNVNYPVNRTQHANTKLSKPRNFIDWLIKFGQKKSFSETFDLYRLDIGHVLNTEFGILVKHERKASSFKQSLWIMWCDIHYSLFPLAYGNKLLWVIGQKME